MLILPIKKKWFDMILSGEKKEEYREIKEYYDSRFSKIIGVQKTMLTLLYGQSETNEFEILFKNGYANNSPSFIADCTLSVGTGKKEWGAEPDKEYYVLHIKKIRWNNFTNHGGYLKSFP